MGSDERKRIGKYIRKLRKEQGLTQAQLAAKCGVSASTITKCEAGETSISFETAQSIAGALNVSLSDLIGTTNEQEADRIISLARFLFESAGYDFFEPWEHCEESYKDLYKVVGHGKSFYLRSLTVTMLSNKASSYFRFELDEFLKRTYDNPEFIDNGGQD